ncbi:MAG TPA: DciA family protein [Jatrophihabitantaceae bacterium]|nr:DciA family protein [Jatrophihabitantaceae bacterium]
MDEDQGKGDESVSPANLARDALNQARGAVGGLPRRSRRRRGAGAGQSGRLGGYSGSGPDERDPQPMGGVLAGLFEDRGWQRPVTEARVFADWEGLVGRDIAQHCRPITLRDGELRLSAESTAWATQLRMMSGSLLAKLVAQLGPNVVVRLSISGPTGPSWKHGAWSVRGSRGPRDTYG